MKGFYLLFLKLDKGKRIKIGSLGEIYFKKGHYIYVGSAMCGEKRVFRHFSKKKKKRWHIDYLLDMAEIEGMLILKGRKGEEVRIAGKLSEILEGIPGFGAGDSPLDSHLFYTEREPFFVLNKVFKDEYIK